MIGWKKIAELKEQKLALERQIYEAKIDCVHQQKIYDSEIKYLTKAEKIEKVWELPELTDSLMDLLEDGFRTGSSVYGDKDAANDIDICILMPPDVFMGYAIGCTNPGYWDADGFTAVYAHKAGILYNILCFSDANLVNAWKRATDIMSEVSHLAPYKWQRVRIFRAFVDVLTPVKEKHKYSSSRKMDISTAVSINKCRRCEREAINFISAETKKKWQQDGYCDRCREYLNGEL